MKLPAPYFRGTGWPTLGALLLTLTVRAFAADPVVATMPTKFKDFTPLEWSTRMANSQMSRSPAKAKWDYTNSLFALCLFKLGERTGNHAYTDYASTVALDCVSADGVITGYKMSDYTLDNLAPGKVLLAFYEKKPEPRLQTALKTLRQQLETQPRTPSGGFWHKQVYPNQMWLDGIFMGDTFYAEYGKDFNEPADFDDVAKQLLLVGDHTYDSKTGLFYHGWDESKTQFWANKETGDSPNFWGRALGWYAMGIVDTLDYLPADHPQRAKIIELLGRVAAGVARWQDPKSGLWWQVLDQGSREGNYLEATASCQFVCALAKAVNKGYLPRDKYLDVISRGYAGIINQLITTDAKSLLSLNQCCSVAGLGGSLSHGLPRDGTFEYYIRENVVSNDLKGIGPFILAGIEIEKLSGATETAKPPTSADSTSSANPKSP